MTAQLGLLAPTEAEIRAEETDGDERGGSIDLRCGRWQDVLADVECDACIFDAPFGERTHKGHDAGATAANRVSGSGHPCVRQVLGYEPMSEASVHEMVSCFAPRTRGWMCSLTDHDLSRYWEDAMSAAGRITFAPIPVIDRGSRVRLSGDGPSNWTVWMVVSRPRNAKMKAWGTLPGLYERSPGDARGARMGGKPLGVMRAIVRDYSRPGDIVCDPFAGRATTLLAAAIELRVAIGSEADPEEHTLAMARLANGYTPDMFARVPPGSEEPSADLPGWAP